MRRSLHICTLPAILLLTTVLVLLAGVPSALASGPRWQLDASTAPTNLPIGGEGQLAITATNVGDGRTSASSEPLHVTFRLPASVSAARVLPFPLTYVGYLNGEQNNEIKCSIVTGSLVRCTLSGEPAIPPYESLEVRLAVNVGAQAESGEVAEIAVEGAEAPGASTKLPLSFGASTPFGIRDFKLIAEGEDGSPQTQAGAHPFQLTSTLDFDQTLEANRSFGIVPSTPELLRNVDVELPPGLIGDAQGFPECLEAQFYEREGGGANLCPADTALGVASVALEEPSTQGFSTIAVPVFNLTPAAGEPARFGFEALGVPVVFDTAVRAGRDYGVNVSVKNTSQAAAIISTRLTLWGTPGDARHDESRGWGCLRRVGPCVTPTSHDTNAFLTLPTACGGPPAATVRATSWAGSETPAAGYSFQSPEGDPLGIDGCNELPFTPSFSVEPEAHAASTASGLAVDVHVPQQTTLDGSSVAESAVRSTTVTLPAGVQVSPSAANGLLACSIGEVGFEGFDSSATGLFSDAPAGCPEASKVGTVRIDTPLLSKPLEGAVYQAAQTANPFSTLLALYLFAEEPNEGVRVKLAGRVSVDPITGQLTSTFENTPQLPFEDLHVQFFGGPRAPLSTPAQCGTYTATASFTPWSGRAPVDATASFSVSSAVGGAPCAGQPPFAPTLSAGSGNTGAGAFAPLSATFSREDGNQNLAGVAVQLPPGLLGTISSVIPCAEPQAALGTCGPSSLIGHTVAVAGLGSDPFTETGGQMFLTGPYKGSPYGLSVTEPAKAGPFDLGEGACDCIVVRARIDVDPHTAAVTVTSDPLPTILQGVPLQLKRINVLADRPGFTFNPTSCARLSIGATFTGEAGATAQASTPFQAANCAMLKFKPTFGVSTQGKTTKADGASLRVKLTFPQSPASGTGPSNGQANVAYVRVRLPKALPARLTTLQKACTAQVFAANPANCPSDSIVGHAKAATPILGVPLEGPAYFVSHANESFPQLIAVLQGAGIVIDLVGDTDIKHGITTSTFAQVPDAPVKSFELSLPQGKFSALAANGKLCVQDLVMPTEFKGQNGAVLDQNTRIDVEGCSLSVVSKKVAAKKITLKIAVPVKGKLKVSGKGLTSSTTTAGGRETVTVTIHRKQSGKSKARVELRFTPSKGRAESRSLAVAFGK